MKNIWLQFTQTDLETELLQLREEGRDLASAQEDIAELRRTDVDSDAGQHRLMAFLDRAQSLPVATELDGQEPNGLDEIRALRPASPELPAIVAAELRERTSGAWYGRAAGCLLGKPLEGQYSRATYPILKESGNWPLHRYLHSEDAGGAWDRLFGEDGWSRAFLLDRLDGMPEDDDMNYTTTGLAIAERYGKSFTSENVAMFWCDFIPVLRTCTAERVAYRNFLNGIAPPHSGSTRNPYREWIGAQIRADFWGYWNPGNPELAAEMAWRDARISHVKNGIYGEMWVAAMIAAAFATSDVKTILDAGLGQIPAGCRLACAVKEVVAWSHAGLSYDEAVSRLRERYDEENWHHFTHTISNAMIVTIGLLWGENDYSLSICRAVQPMFDTDCNGATVGSIFGAAYGVQSIPDRWTLPIADKLSTGVKGYEHVSISDLVDRTLALQQT
jgi:ADP-ribosylglycohydrolase